jgi:hypothetical protein
VRIRIVVFVLAATACALSASTAVGAPTKPIAMDVEPVSEFAGVTDNAYKFTLTNNTKTQQLGSADITVPAAFTVVSGPSLGTLTAGNEIELRNLNVPPEGSVTVTLGLRMPCESGPYV